MKIISITPTPDSTTGLFKFVVVIECNGEQHRGCVKAETLICLRSFQLYFLSNKGLFYNGSPSQSHWEALIARHLQDAYETIRNNAVLAKFRPARAAQKDQVGETTKTQEYYEKYESNVCHAVS
jgi:hypothetical protein